MVITPTPRHTYLRRTVGIRRIGTHVLCSICVNLRNLRFSSETRMTQPPLQLLIFRQFNSQVAQLLWIDLRGGLRHEVHAAVVLWESHYVADALFTADQHHQTIEAQGDSSMWRRSEPKRSE